MKYIVIFPEHVYEEARTFLLRDPHNEQFGYFFAGANTTDKFIKLLVHSFIPAQERGDLEYQGGGGICPSAKFQMHAYSICKKEGYHLIDVHSHPFDSSGQVKFSSIDDRYEFGNGREGVFGFTAMWNPDMYHASIVFGQNSLDARIYRREEGRPVAIDEVRILVTRSIIPTSALYKAKRSGTPKDQDFEISLTNLKKNLGGNSGAVTDTVYSRQILAFGQGGQDALAETTVGIVGAGGLGSIVVETLARLGVKEIICIDNDLIESSNLSRVLGSTWEDAEKGSKKVDVLGRHACAINPNLAYTPIADTILNPKALEILKYADYIISGTDTYSSRLVLNQFSNQYLIPYIDLGFGMETDSQRQRLVSAGGKIITIIPGHWCFNCLGEIDQRALQIELMSTESKSRQIARGYISGVEIPNPSVLFLNMTVASLGICEFMNLLAPFKERNSYLFYDMLATKLWKIEAKQKLECVVCSPQAEILGRGDLLLLEDIRDKSTTNSLPQNV